MRVAGDPCDARADGGGAGIRLTAVRRRVARRAATRYVAAIMMQTFPRMLAGAPALVAEPTCPDTAMKVVLWCHGFRADALAHAADLERCAAAGFLAVGVDAAGHGARSDPTLNARVRESRSGALPVMLEQVEQTVAELPAILDDLSDKYPIDRNRVSMVGVSMGAYLAYRSIVAGPPLRSVVALLGSPEWPGITSPHLSLRSFRRVALLSITAEHDDSVPPAAATRLHAALSALTLPSSQAHHHYVLRGARHLTSAEEWQRAMRVTMGWLERMG
jgi:uncharacterized protein